MNQEVGLRVLGQIMGWNDERARDEFRWLRLMARLKYDDYADFQAGVRFIESLVAWLQQFKGNDRETAYKFIRENLVYISRREMQRLVDLFYPTVHEDLVRTLALEHSIPTYRVLAELEESNDISRLRRQTLFMGLSDGARIDTLRHVNAGLLNNEQLVQGIQVDKEKWQDLLRKLRKDLSDETATFRMVYLIDDFAGTGTTFLRLDDNEGWQGKLMKFRDSTKAVCKDFGGPLFAPDWELRIHHYMASATAAQNIKERICEVRDAFSSEGSPRAISASFGTILPDNLPISSDTERHQNFLRLTDIYYDPNIETKHTRVGGVQNLKLGYGGCALPLVLDHNTPNNTVALLWAETKGENRNGVVLPAMRPLFRRRQRHI